MTILYVDNDTEARTRACTYFDSQDVNVIEARSAMIGINTLGIHPIEFVLIDLGLRKADVSKLGNLCTKLNIPYAFLSEAPETPKAPDTPKAVAVGATWHKNGAWDAILKNVEKGCFT